MGCLDDDDIARFVAEPANSPWRVEREAHLDGCGGCRARAALAMIDLGGEALPASTVVEPAPRDTGRSFRFRIGDEVGGYRLEERLGEGGMGVVFGARLAATGEERALKFLVSAGRKNERRALREALAMGIHRPAIVPVLDVLHRVDVAPVLVMPRLRGQTLATRLRPTLPEAGRVVTCLLEALEAIHGGGAVHRDLKPSNVFVEDSGAVRILDFGLVWLDADHNPLAGQTRLTTTAKIVGTPRYLPPEVLHGAPPDARADLWGLGHIAFELLTGEPALRAPHAGGFLREIAKPDPIVRADVRDPSVPRVLADVVRALLEKDPAARIPSSALALDRWRAALALSGIEAPRRI